MTPFYKVVFGSYALLVTMYAEKYELLDKNKQFPKYPRDLLLPQTKEYDFIIAGAGSAGSIVASHLSKEFSVLLLDSGGDPVPSTFIPANFGHVISVPSVLHSWYSIPQTHSALLFDGIAHIVQAKFFGGTSVVNALMYNRGHAKDYDQWAEMVGDESWNYANSIKYFKLTEKFFDEENPNGELGVDGPLFISKGGKEMKTIYDAFLNGVKEIGLETLDEANVPQRAAFGPVFSTTKNGRRVSAHEAFLKPILNRKRLTVSKYSEVSHVDIDDTGRAVGVFYTRHGVQSYARAKKEVIVSAGALNSPMILLRSGIGPAAQLKEANIELRVDLPVGQNFQDHPWSAVTAKFDNPSNLPLKNFGQKEVDEFLLRGRGPLTLPWGVHGQGFYVSSIAKAEGTPDWPDTEYIILHNAEMYAPTGDNTIAIMCMLGRVASRGSISLDTKNTSNPVGIWDPKWLEDERDVKVIAEAIKVSAQLLDSQAFKTIGVSLDRTKMKGCEDKEYGSDEYWICHVRHFTRTTYHPVGTCRMGKDDDPNSVVDTKLKVKGVKALRVIDNSIQPTITNANTNAPALMIGQRGAQMILDEWRNKKSTTGVGGN